MKTLAFSLSALTLAIISTAVQPAPNTEKMYGAAAPFTIDKLPSGRLKAQLERLPLPAQQRAMTWLHDFDFPEQDIDFIHVDSQGGVFYEDTVLPEQTSQTDLEADPTLEGINPVNAFDLHSKPGAANVVYVNFTGYTISGTAWNNGAEATYQAKPFNKDGDATSFSSSERSDIGQIWHRIAEDLAPFDIDVTTELPASFGPNVGHILITSDTDADGKLMPYNTAGGVAYIGVWGRSNYEYYQPALVYYDNLGSGHPPYVSEAASHELGHNLNLSHDGTSSVTYYGGHGSGLSSWASIMGVGYYNNVTQWSKGEYADANNTQDDLNIIQGQLTYRSDDHSNDQPSATALLVDGNGYIASSDPEFDPLNVRPDNKGIIETSSDSDMFYFDTASGDINLVITPAWDAYTRSSRRGANLDIKATLTDGNGTNIVDDVLDDTNAVISANVTAGRYYLEITGVGNAAIPYSDYGSLGQYYIAGSVIPASLDATAPNPNPLFWAIDPTAVNKTSISMTTTNAVDDSGFVEYQFLCSNGGTGCIASAWQTDSHFIASGLAANTSYSYQVKARDSSGNETGLSNTATATTLANIAPQSQDDFVTANENTETSINVLANDNDDDGDTLQLYSTSVPAHGDIVINTNNAVYTPDADYVGADNFSYTITDGFGGFSSSTVSIDVIAVNDPPITASDSAEVLLGGTVVIDVLTNDSDPEGADLSIVSATNGSKGSSSINIDGTITYTVTGNKRGGDSFSYIVSDGELTSIGTVNVSIVRKLSGGGDSGGGNGKCHPKKGC
ncbi:MAG: Ig-like domain-containing protein [Methylophagaceae bacterium]